MESDEETLRRTRIARESEPIEETPEPPYSVLYRDGVAEKRLLLAVLCRAVLDAIWPSYGVDRREYNRCRRWLGLDSDRPNMRFEFEDYFSFRFICEQLDQDPTKTWQKIKELEVGVKEKRFELTPNNQKRLMFNMEKFVSEGIGYSNFIVLR